VNGRWRAKVPAPPMRGPIQIGLRKLMRPSAAFARLSAQSVDSSDLCLRLVDLYGFPFRSWLDGEVGLFRKKHNDCMAKICVSRLPTGEVEIFRQAPNVLLNGVTIVVTWTEAARGWCPSLVGVSKVRSALPAHVPARRPRLSALSSFGLAVPSRMQADAWALSGRALASADQG
jgi:hypothetical protein